MAVQQFCNLGRTVGKVLEGMKFIMLLSIVNYARLFMKLYNLAEYFPRAERCERAIY